MRIKVVLHYLGLLIAIIGLAMLLPLGWSLFDSGREAPSFAISMAISLGVGLLLWRLLSVKERGINRREAILLVAGGWISASLFGALPYFLSGALPGFLDAYFEAMSGYTATGATVLTSIETQAQSILLWRNLTQWLGGMGIITLFVAMFPVLGIGAAYLVEAEMAGLQTEKLTARIRDTAKAVWLIYIGFSILEIIALLIAGLPFFEAMTVSFGTMATGGFTPTNLSIGTYNSPLVEGIVIFFMIIAATNFGVHYLILWKRQLSSLFKNAELRFYLTLLTGACLIISLNLFYNGSSVTDAFRFGVFNTVSIGTTTGFATADFNAWPALSKAVLLILMLIGGSAGSTAGGIKTIRLLVLAKCIYRRIVSAFNPKAVIPIRVGNSILSESVVSGFIGMVLLYLSTVIIAFLLLSATGLDHVTAISAVLTNMATVGPGLGLIGPMENYHFIPPLGKGVIIFCQLAGRLELFTLLMLFTPAFWKWR